MEPTTPMVGRESELELLMSHMGKAMVGEGGLVLISGEAGSGKTTLCEEFGKLALKSDCLILVGRCIPASKSPYLPFMEAFFDQVLNPFAISNEYISTNTGKLLLSILESIEQLSKDRVLVLWLEDLHWADSASIALVYFLARNVRTLKVLLLATYRPEDIHVTSSGELHPLKESLRIMRREGICSELELNPLDPLVTKQIVSLKLGGVAEDPLLDLVAEESKGNPLFAVEIIGFLASSGQVVHKDGTWRLRRKMKIQIPPTVREVILARLEHIPKETKQVLDCASVIGEWFEPYSIEEGLSINRMRLLDELEMLEKEYRLIIEEGGKYRFTHEKVRQVVYEQISRPRKKELHRSIGLTLEKRLPGEYLLSPLSYHFDEADENEKCIKYSLLAGKYCYRRRALKEAKSYFQLVLSRTDNERKFISEILAALEGLGDLKSDVSAPNEWYSYYERFLELNQDKSSRARVLAKAAECWDQVGLSNMKKAYELLDEAESISGDDPKILSIIEYRRAELCCNIGKLYNALVHNDKARCFFHRIGDSIGELNCRILEMTVLQLERRYAEAKEVALELLPLAKDLGDPEPLQTIELQTVLICTMIGEIEPVKKLASNVIEFSNKLGMKRSSRLALIARAQVLELEGQVEKARFDAMAALENALNCDAPADIAICQIELGRYEAELGNLESADYLYDEALRTTSTIDTWISSKLGANLICLKAKLMEGIGAYNQSDEIYREAIRFNEESSQAFELLNCRCRYGMSLALRGMSDEARTQFDLAKDAAMKIGCEKRVQAFAERIGIII